MAVNKVVVNGTTIIDLTEDTAEATDVRSGKTFHHKCGEEVTGEEAEYEAGAGIDITENVISTETRLVDITEAAYNALSTDEKNDPAVYYSITDAKKIMHLGEQVINDERVDYAYDAGFVCKNLLNYIQKYSSNPNIEAGITYTVNYEEGTITANGTATATSFRDIVPTAKFSDLNLINGKRYKLVGCPSGGSYDLQIKVRQEGGTYDIGNGYIFTYLDTITDWDIIIRIGSGVTVSNKVFKPMLVDADVFPNATYDDFQKYIKSNIELDNAKVDKTSLATVATTGSYNDLTNKPTIVKIGTTTGTALDGKVGTDHINNTTSHITSAERTAWNAKTSNTGTVTSVAVKMNDSTKGTVTTSGTIDLGTVITDISGKVDKVSGKGLSTNDYNDEEQTKLSNVKSVVDVAISSGFIGTNLLSYPYYSTSRDYSDTLFTDNGDGTITVNNGQTTKDNIFFICYKYDISKLPNSCILTFALTDIESLPSGVKLECAPISHSGAAMKGAVLLNDKISDSLTVDKSTCNRLYIFAAISTGVTITTPIILKPMLVAKGADISNYISPTIKSNVELTNEVANKVDNTSTGVSNAINKLTTGNSDPQDADYYVCQYAGGGTTTTTYHRRPMSALWNYIKSKVEALGYTKNSGTVTSVAVKMNNSVKGTVTSSGTIDLGTVITSHQDISGKVNKSGDTITGSISRDSGGSWINGRDNAAIKQTKHTISSGSSWNPVASVKTNTGNWTIGNVGDDKLGFSFDTDANYNARNNTSTVISLPNSSAGTIALTSDIPSSLPANGGNADTVDGYHANSFFKDAGSNPTCGNGQTITQPTCEAAVSIRTTTGTGRDVGIIHLSQDSCYVANSADSGYAFGVFDTDMTTNMSSVDEASFVVLQSKAGCKIAGNTVIHSGNIGSQSVDFANEAGTAYKVWTQSHPDSWYVNSNWDGTYFQTNAKATNGSTLPIKVNSAGYADSAGGVSGYTTHTLSGTTTSGESISLTILAK